ncbi:hypothetical protein B484DRAFT_212822 [Ochromonadaceae sp. CCMP2298]|nr:hypothetical protein B484DRAFT_212822 [Ochromonadaceae sp. CCMP2298]
MCIKPTLFILIYVLNPLCTYICIKPTLWCWCALYPLHNDLHINPSILKHILCIIPPPSIMICVLTPPPLYNDI